MWSYIVVKGTITIQTEDNKIIDRNVMLANNAPFVGRSFRCCNSYIQFDWIQEKLHISGTLWNYYKDIPIHPITNSESFKYKTSIPGKTAININTKDVQFFVPLKHLSNFWRRLDIPLTNCEGSLTLTWPENCVITDETTQDADLDPNPPRVEIRAPTVATFKITDTKLYIPFVTLSIQDDNRLLEQLKTGFKRTIKRNECLSDTSNQAKTNNEDYLIDPTFSKINKLFVLLF